MNSECPYCQIRIAEHEATDCGNAWMASLIGWKIDSSLLDNEIYAYESQDDIHRECKPIPPFTTSFDAQAEHVWPLITKSYSLEFRFDSILREYRADVNKDYDMLEFKTSQASLILASWRVCIAHFETLKEKI